MKASTTLLLIALAGVTAWLVLRPRLALGSRLNPFTSRDAAMQYSDTHPGQTVYLLTRHGLEGITRG